MPNTQSIEEFVDQRLSRGQGYRLLEGWPSRKLMDGSVYKDEGDYGVSLDPNKDLIMGVIPSPYCDPAVEGCGFCSFPHLQYEGQNLNPLMIKIGDEISTRSRDLGIYKRKVSSIYFGGGTANLISAEDFEFLVGRLNSQFDISTSEVSFEGVASYFLKDRRSLIESLEYIPGKNKRVSVGIQTFNTDWLETMGRTHFGNEKTFRKLVRFANEGGISVSGDFMINLPGQKVEEMLADVKQADEIGLDQICVYNNVLFEGIGSLWSNDPEMMAKRPEIAQAFENWKQVRAYLLEQGFTQTTLTNFERPGSTQFQYELLTYRPQTTDGIGFGPSGITVVSDQVKQIGFKRSNPEHPAHFLEIRTFPNLDMLHDIFHYDSSSLLIMNLARNFSRGYADLSDFTASPVNDLKDSFEVLEERGLLTIDKDRISLTPKGMFFEDTVVATLAKDETKKIFREQRRAMMDDDWGGGGM